MASVTVLYFAWLRERIGLGEQHVTLPPQVDRVDRLIDHLAATNDAAAAAFARRAAIRCAVNQRLADPDTAVEDGDEVAFFPPVTGG